MNTLLSSETIVPNTQVKSVVIWLHGLGASGHDFVPIIPQLKLPDEMGVKFVFPHVPERPVTLNMGMNMPAWYDIFGLHRDAQQDKAGVLQAVSLVNQLIEHEHQSTGVPYEKIILAGFSQGGAVALATALTHPKRLGGVLALSTYLPIAEDLLANASDANRQLPIMMVHGTHDMVLNLEIAELSLQYLAHHHYPVEWKTYPMAHEVCMQEVIDISGWLKKILAAA
ncbi:MAG: carboxylesterase [Legionellaceae bacterium]|nr:carboxylesterase [Legionellaceae bacterium]